MLAVGKADTVLSVSDATIACIEARAKATDSQGSALCRIPMSRTKSNGPFARLRSQGRGCNGTSLSPE